MFQKEALEKGLILPVRGVNLVTGLKDMNINANVERLNNSIVKATNHKSKRCG